MRWRDNVFGIRQLLFRQLKMARGKLCPILPGKIEPGNLPAVVISIVEPLPDSRKFNFGRYRLTFAHRPMHDDLVTLSEHCVFRKVVGPT